MTTTIACPHCGRPVETPQTTDRKTFLAVLRRYAKPLGLSIEEAQERRFPRAVAARLFAYRELKNKGWEFARIGRAAGRDHSSIIYALKRHVPEDMP